MTTQIAATTGAKLQSWEKDNPRELVLRLINESPKASENAIATRLCKLLQDDESEFLLPLCRYYVRNTLMALVHEEKRQAGLTNAARRAATDALVERIKANLLEAPLLPAGKLLGDCTSADLNRTEGWLARIRNKLGPKQRVRDVFSEQQLRALRQ